MRILSVFLLVSGVGLSAVAAPLYESQFIFKPSVRGHGLTHASCIVQCPNGDLLAVWYESGPPLPPPFYMKQHDKADNVRIGASRKPRGAKKWGKTFVMADTFGASDNNPCMVIDHQKRLWLIYATLVGVPEWTWDSALVRYAISTDYEKPGVPVWNTQNVLLPRPTDFKSVIDAAILRRSKEEKWSAKQIAEAHAEEKHAFSILASKRLGWMPRAHPLVRSDGALVLPLGNENFSLACMAITKDGGKTWAMSKPVPDIGLEQPTLVEYPDKTIVGFFRNDGPEHRIKRSVSHDGGMTWGPVTLTDRPHPCSGIEAILLKDGDLMLVYNDAENSRDSLAVSISQDRGKTWKWTRHLEDKPGGRFDYPSIIQAQDGTLDVTYSYYTKTIKYAHFNEDWVKAGDGAK